MHLPPRLALILAVPAIAVACAADPPPLPPPPPPRPAPPPAPPVRSPDWATLKAESETRTIDIRLAPVRDDKGEVEAVDVGIGLSERPGELGDPSPFVLQLARSEGGEAPSADSIEDLFARDTEAAFTLQPVAAAAPGPWATWRAQRRPNGAIHIDYRVKIARGGPDRVHGTRAAAGGFEGTGATLLLLPDAPGTFSVRQSWDLDGAGPDAKAVSSLGEAASVETTLADLRDAVFMAGPIGRLDVSSRGARLTGAWLGSTAFDPLDAIPWVMRARARVRAFFHEGQAGAFSMFVRVVPQDRPAFLVEPRGAGLLFLPSEQQPFDRDVRFAITAELIRREIGGTGAPPLFLEGLAIHGARQILLREGLATRADFADDLNRHGAHQGMLYAAELDAAVRAKGDGHRSLDDLVRALAERARAGAPLPAGTWRDVIGSEIGPEGQARYDAVIVRGEPAAPPLTAYGPCFKGERPAKRGAALVWRPDPKQPDAACTRSATP